MIFKNADDRSSDLADLNALMGRADCTPEVRRKIEQELRNIEAGVRGEEEAAYEIKVRCGESQNWAVLHDLRIEFGGLVAQIDHLVIDRWLDMWVCESKSFSEGIEINDHGEFSAFFMGKSYGIPSPIEQNANHILILKRLFETDTVKLPRRLGLTIRPNLRGLVLVSKKATITRPKKSTQDIGCVIKNDGFSKALEKSLGKNSVLALAKSIGCDTLHDIGRQLAGLHRPLRFNWASKFGFGMQVGPPLLSHVTNPIVASLNGGDREGATVVRQALVCNRCGVSVSPGVADFCVAWKSRFNGQTFCMPCQRAV